MGNEQKFKMITPAQFERNLRENLKQAGLEFETGELKLAKKDSPSKLKAKQ